MFEVKQLNKIAKIGLNLLGENITISDTSENPDGILLRSADMHSMELSTNLKAIARAGAGVNNIPVEQCADRGIVVFNTPGANANAVKELTICGLLISCRKVSDGIAWAKTLANNTDDVPKAVEKGKSDFTGPELYGKTLGVVGLGAIGVMVANVAEAFGMEVIGYDPYISIDAAWGLSRSVKKATNLNDLFQKSDFITLHLPLGANTKGMLDENAFAQMKDGVRILNFSRGELINEVSMRSALDNGKVSTYVTDFPNANVLTMKNIIAIPHLGASTPESEDNCAMMAASELREYLENGNIRNSVNYPNCEMPRGENEKRICVAHRNIPNMLGQISSIVAKHNINIQDMLNKSKGNYAYTMAGIETDIPDELMKELEAVEGILRVRVL